MSIVAYLWILFIIPLLFKRKDDFVHFHARQGMVLFLVSIAIFIFMLIPFIGPVFGSLMLIAILVLYVAGIVNAIFGKKWVMPLIGEWAQRLDL